VPPAIDLRVRQRQSTTVRLPGYAGSATADGAVANYLVARNLTVPTASANHELTGGFTGGGACTQPTN
jgi:hypothetical protein